MKPNIILMVLDTVKAGNLSMWGYRKKTTPFLDKLSNSAVTYKQATATSPWTLPSHVSMFSGLYPSEHGVLTSKQQAGANLPLIADVLQTSGYQTAGFTSNPWASSIYSLDRGFDLFVEVYKELKKSKESFFDRNIRRAKHLICMQDGGTDLTNKYVKRWLNSIKDNDKPFFAFINYMDAHSPYLPKRSLPWSLSPYSISQVLKSRKLIVNMGKICVGSMRPTNEDFQYCINLYDDAIRYLDFKIAELVEYLKENSILDNTMIIITSDHGENFGEHKSPYGGVLMFHFFCLYDTLLHVPLIVKFPFEEYAGKKVHLPVQLTEIPFMIADAAGVNFDVSRKKFNCSYLEGLKSRNNDTDDTITFAEYVTDHLHLGDIRKTAPDLVDKFELDLKSARSSKYKLILSNKSGPELYDLTDDPGELYNIAIKYPDMVKELKNKIDNWQSQLVRNDLPETNRVAEEEAVKVHLQELGYI